MATALDTWRESAVLRPSQIDFPGFDIGPDDVLVDVGCGMADVCVYAGNRGAEVIGVDIEPVLIERAEALMRETPARSFQGIVSDASPIPLPDGCATVVVATEVMEHVDDPAQFLSELFRIGRPGARYLFSVPDPVSERVMRVVAPSWYWEKPLHIHVFEHAELDAMVAQSGLRIEGRHAVGFCWSMHWFLRMAVGMEHKYADVPDHPVFPAWDKTVATLIETPGGARVIAELDQLVPKSQVIIARKPGGGASARFGARRSRLRRLIRDGGVRLAGYHLRWSVRRGV